ncbi:hypothetical protein H0H87_001880 [Tephrocybe sp. NHM501043]|nr:hypothetical protein H0H87_001880 [Tephrocybe sp. NHM501043]
MNMEWESMPTDGAHAYHAVYFDNPTGEIAPAVPFSPYAPDLSTNHYNVAKPQVNAYDDDNMSGSFESASFTQSEQSQNTEFDHCQQAPYVDVDDEQVPYMELGCQQEPPYAASVHCQQGAYMNQAPHTPYNRPAHGHSYLCQQLKTNRQGPPRVHPGPSMGPPCQQHLKAHAPSSRSDAAGSLYPHTPRGPHM